MARQVVEKRWGDDFVFGVVKTSLMRPGRGQSARGSNRGGWRYEERTHELTRFSRYVTELIEGLRSGSLTADDAQRAVEEGPYAGFVLVADSKARMVECLAERFRAGDNAWVEGWTDPRLAGNRVLLLDCWHDRSHRRIA